MTAAAIELCVGAVVLDDGQILLVRRGRGRSAGTWSIPGGHVEVGETMAEAVVRELQEETGLVGVCDELIGWVEHIDDDGHVVIFDFGVTILDSAVPVAGDDAAEAAWVPCIDADALPLAGGLLEFLYANGILGTTPPLV